MIMIKKWKKTFTDPRVGKFADCYLVYNLLHINYKYSNAV